MKPEIKNIDTEILSDNWYVLKKVSFDYKMPDGNWVHQARECYDRGNGATVLMYNQLKGTVILVKQFRMPSYINGNQSGVLIETCAGLLDGDDPETCVRKEALEETGIRLDQVEKVFKSYMSPGAVTEIIHFFIAAYDDSMKVEKGGGVEDEQEDIEILEIPFRDAYDMIEKGEIVDAKTIMLLQYLKINGIMEIQSNLNK